MSEDRISQLEERVDDVTRDQSKDHRELEKAKERLRRVEVTVKSIKEQADTQTVRRNGERRIHGARSPADRRDMDTV